eukprot:615498-Amphidinium_carterae.1
MESQYDGLCQGGAVPSSGFGAEGVHAVGGRGGAEQVVPPRSDGPKRKEYKSGKAHRRRKEWGH